jgi:hypothetical protein
MLRVALKLLLAAAAVAAVWAFVPIHGRTMEDRWQRARTPREFVSRVVSEVRGGPAKVTTAKHHREEDRQEERAPLPARPTESHTSEDRKALDQIVSKHLDKG